MLLERNDVNSNTADAISGLTPLLRAAENGRKRVVRILMERNDVNSNKADKRGRTPLWWAAGSGYEGVVRILLGQNDVNRNRANTTPNMDGDYSRGLPGISIRGS